MLKHDPHIKRALWQLVALFVAGCAAVVGATVAGASDGLLLVLTPVAASACSLFAVVRVLPMCDAADRRRAEEAARSAAEDPGVPAPEPRAVRPLRGGGASRALG
jgi:hypothetical protein